MVQEGSKSARKQCKFVHLLSHHRMVIIRLRILTHSYLISANRLLLPRLPPLQPLI